MMKKYKTIIAVMFIMALFSCQKEIISNQSNALKESTTSTVTPESQRSDNYYYEYYTIDWGFVNPCTNEQVRVSGSLKSVDKITYNPSTGHYKWTFIYSVDNVTVTGSYGTIYKFSWSESEINTGGSLFIDNDVQTDNAVARTHLIGPNGTSMLAIGLIHISVFADRPTYLLFENFNTKWSCH